ncbi:DHH family phosphoesterase [Halocatena salina]|uniref:Recombinase RecJ n=1 Tax=Halocatena salina TaxID=2934340 RepID=A0A8T9ZZN1_9EURY|nr:recombinase RecJ [Halocatena salina]UPM41986.1 recombinase RecJ [Halocatena salina]
MNESLIDADQLPLARKSILPGTGFFVPDDEEDGPNQERIETLSRADTVVIADSDADGLGCAALIRTYHDDALTAEVDPTMAAHELPNHDVAIIPAAPHSLTDAQQQVIEYTSAGVTVYICDLCPDRDSDIEPLSELTDHADSVRWFDHHQWTAEYERRVRAAGVDLVVGDSETECSTDVALESLDEAFSPRFQTLAAVTRDHDLWLREDPRSDDLADFAQWIAPEIYVATVRRHGVDFPDAVEAYITRRRVEKERLIEKAVERAELRELTVPSAGVGAPDNTDDDADETEDASAEEDDTPLTVGVTYGRCSQNEVAEALREQGADAAVVVKPSGPVSIRGTETFARCHEVAKAVGGGGHPKAAGCKPDIYDDMLDYAHHWTTRGAIAKRLILDAFRSLPQEPSPEDDATA